jgi:hypothetical protein
MLPAFPEPTGANPQKAKFFAEVACGLEFLGLFYELNAAEQAELLDHLRGLVAVAAQRKLA